MKPNNKIWLGLMAFVWIIYILLRLWHLTDSCLWFDEIFSVHAAEHDWENLIWFVGQDLIHPPLFYALLKVWISAGGESLFWLRFFPVFFSILTLVPLFYLGRELKLKNSTITLALLFLAVNGCLIKYAQEVRMYSVLLFLALFSMWLFVRFLNLGKNFWILTIVNILLIYTHYFGWLVVLSEISVIVFLQRIKLRQILIMFGILLVSFVPWILMLWKAAAINSNLGQNIGWIARPDLTTLFQFLFDLIEPFYFQHSNIAPGSIYFITIPLLLTIMSAFVIYFIQWKNAAETEKQNLYLLTIFTKLPILLALILSWILPYSIWGTRHLIFVFVPFAFLTAVALDKINLKSLKIALLGLLLILTGAAFCAQIMRGTPVFIWCAWEHLAQDLDPNKPAKIYVFEDFVAYHLWFTLRGADQNFQIVKVNGLKELPEDPAYFLPRGFEAVQKTDENGLAGERFYIAFRAAEWNELEPPLSNLRQKGYKIGEPKVFEAQNLKAFLVLVEKEK